MDRSAVHQPSPPTIIRNSPSEMIGMPRDRAFLIFDEPDSASFVTR